MVDRVKMLRLCGSRESIRCGGEISKSSAGQIQGPTDSGEICSRRNRRFQDGGGGGGGGSCIKHQL